MTHMWSPTLWGGGGVHGRIIIFQGVLRGVGVGRGGGGRMGMVGWVSWCRVGGCGLQRSGGWCN